MNCIIKFGMSTGVVTYCRKNSECPEWTPDSPPTHLVPTTELQEGFSKAKAWFMINRHILHMNPS